ncbi:MAG: MFS transporter [Planctomycetaceae bacterium]
MTLADAPSPSPADVPPGAADPARTAEITHIRHLSGEQWKSGIAAWLGWLFDGLDMQLYVLVATPFVAELLGLSDMKDPQVGYYSSWIQAAFLIGWALGGGFFGRVADKMGRSRALMLTILVYAFFTGMSYFAQTWWHLLIFRFLAALGIGGEWAVGAAILSETWPKTWRPWIAAVLQTAVNLGMIVASLATYLLAALPHRTVFLVGVLPAFIVLWIRHAVPEPEEWQGAKRESAEAEPGFSDLFRGPVRRITFLTLFACGLSLTAHWAFMFWYLQHLRNLPEMASWTEAEKSQLVSKVMSLLMVASIAGNFVAAWLARRLTYRRTIALMCIGYFLAIACTYGVDRPHEELWIGLTAMGLCQGLFGLYTMYLPPLFPTLLRTTGAGFCYNFGRIVAGFGTVFFGLFSKVGDYRLAIVYAGFLFVPAAAFAWMLPEAPEERMGSESDV